jgi:hypothetical protein
MTVCSKKELNALKTHFSSIQFAYPDVPELDRTVVPLDHEWQLGGVRLVGVSSFVCHGPQNFCVILHQHTVVQHSDSGSFKKFSLFKYGCRKDNIIALPLTGPPAGMACW